MAWRNKLGRLRAFVARSETMPDAGNLAPDLEIPPPPEEWAVGDIAECIHSGPWFIESVIPAHGPQMGERIKVTDLYIASIGICAGIEMLSFARLPLQGFDARFFRKVRPRKDDAIGAIGADFRDLLPSFRQEAA